ncbi:MAG TPA: hypothetical protein VHM19_14430, partial [Polyangiales bacterium]|nr:hypothetical protein [Polyangiales bacterium]
ITINVMPDAERPMVLESYQIADDGQSMSLRGVQIESSVEPHGNSAASTKVQHLYEIYETNGGDVVKTGISGQELNGNGSPRANRQVNALNREHGAGTFSARLVQTGIPNRTQALGAEAANAARLKAEGNSMRFHRRP